MEDVEFETKKVFKNWDDCGLDVELYNHAIREKIHQLESNIKKSKYDVINRLAEQPYSDKIEQDIKFNQKLQHRIMELEKEKEKLEMQILTDKKIHELEKSNIELKAKLSEKSTTELKWEEEQKSTLDPFQVKELIQEKLVLFELNAILEETINSVEKEKFKLEIKNQTSDKLHELEKSNIELKTKLENHSENLREAKQEKSLLTEKVDSREKTSFSMMRKYYLTIAITGLIIGGFVAGFTFYENSIEKDPIMLIGEHAKSKYLVQNLRGDTLKTWFPWMLVGNQALHVNILDNSLATPERIDAIKNAIISEEILDIDNVLVPKGPKGTTSTYYKGWVGALNIAAQQNTELKIPTIFEISSSKKPIGDITVELSSLSDPDGYSGYTKSVVDQGEILKSHIKIYDANSLSTEQLSIIFLHEFGHALGLAHSSAPDDLMYPVIETNFPYVSECMVDAITGLYDGIKSSEVECQN
ncbi:MAG TPA: matrixin family metalloprotease [Nitrosopumilus sp.]|nr:matrixin family metalloprotease [Thermoproteota archaeon]HJJ23111.1 matrixin family metalloprotease [Nitrosopumilus sp.]